MKKAVFLCIEGGDAVGKSTQMSLLQKSLTNKNISYLTTREPGGVDTSEEIRNLLFSNNLEFNPLTETLLFTASRHENIVKCIMANINKYDVILVDRFILSTLVYQGFVAGVDDGTILQLHRLCNFDLYPDLTILLQADITQIMDRIDKKDLRNKIDDKSANFHGKVLEGYRYYQPIYQGKLETVDASANTLNVHRTIINIINASFDFDLIPSE